MEKNLKKALRAKKSEEKFFKLSGDDSKKGPSIGGAGRKEEDLPKHIRSALNILDYADNTEKRLREKLFRKNYTPDEIEEAVAYVKDIGCLNDAEYIKRAAEYMAEVKLYGRYRIKKALAEKGFSFDDIGALDLSAFDFFAICEKRIEKSRYKSRQALCAALQRYGFTRDEIESGIENTGVFPEEEE